MDRLRITAERGQVIGGLGTLLESGEISITEVDDILGNWEFQRTITEPLIITFGLNYFDTLEMRGMDSTEPLGYAIICTQLELELVDFLRAETPKSFHYAEASGRTGETLSVRLVFPELEISEVDSLPLSRIEQLMPWWEVVEVSNFSLIYGITYEEAEALP